MNDHLDTVDQVMRELSVHNEKKVCRDKTTIHAERAWKNMGNSFLNNNIFWLNFDCVKFPLLIGIFALSATKSKDTFKVYIFEVLSVVILILFSPKNSADLTPAKFNISKFSTISKIVMQHCNL